MNFEEAINYSLTVPWKIAPCFAGEECWCRMVFPVEPILVTGGDDLHIIGAASIDQKTAEYIVGLHNAKIGHEVRNPPDHQTGLHWQGVDLNVIESIKTKIIKDSINIQNSRAVIKYLSDDMIKSLKLTGFLSKELTNLFGKCNKRMRLEEMTQVWVLKYKDLVFNIFTSKNKGTSIELVTDNFKHIKNPDVLNFIKQFSRYMDYQPNDSFL